MHYQFDLYGRFAGASETATNRSTEVAPPELTPDYNWNGVSWMFAPNIQTAPVVVAQPTPPAPSRILTKLAWVDRFTDEEMAAIYTAAKVNIQVEVWLEKFKISQEVDLDDQRLIAGVQGLEAAGLLAEGRAAEILSVE